jgi:RNA polymerase sigma-70 factor (sigma-E family)
MATVADVCAGDPIMVAGRLPRAAMLGVAARSTRQAADEAVTVMYQTHYAALVRAAVFLVGEVATAEDVVQDCFIAMHRAWWQLRDTSSALPYLRRSVINRSRSVLRHRAVMDRLPPEYAPVLPSAEESALAVMQRSSVLAALSTLPVRQREVVVLRYYADLSEAQTAAAIGISKNSVKSHVARAKDSLRAVLVHYCNLGSLPGSCPATLPGTPLRGNPRSAAAAPPPLWVMRGNRPSGPRASDIGAAADICSQASSPPDSRVRAMVPSTRRRPNQPAAAVTPVPSWPCGRAIRPVRVDSCRFTCARRVRPRGRAGHLALPSGAAR